MKAGLDENKNVAGSCFEISVKMIVVVDERRTTEMGRDKMWAVQKKGNGRTFEVCVRIMINFFFSFSR